MDMARWRNIFLNVMFRSSSTLDRNRNVKVNNFGPYQQENIFLEKNSWAGSGKNHSWGLTHLVFSVLSENYLSLFVLRRAPTRVHVWGSSWGKWSVVSVALAISVSPERNENNRAGGRIEFARSSHQENSITTQARFDFYFNVWTHLSKICY